MWGMRQLAIANRAGLYSYYLNNLGAKNSSLLLFYFELWIQQLVYHMFGLTWITLNILSLYNIKIQKYLGFKQIYRPLLYKWSYIYTGRVWIFNYQEWTIIRVNYLYIPNTKLLTTKKYLFKFLQQKKHILILISNIFYNWNKTFNSIHNNTVMVQTKNYKYLI